MHPGATAMSPRTGFVLQDSAFSTRLFSLTSALTLNWPGIVNDADNEQWRDAFRRLREERAVLHGDNRYLEAQQRLHRRLL
jgi:hypothetical protein